MKELLKKSRLVSGLYRKARRARWRHVRERIIEQYLANRSVRKLQLGSGTNVLPGWLNTDGAMMWLGNVYVDLREPLPFPDEAFDFAFCEHTIEHIHYADARAFLRECRRVVKPGGILRITTPDLQSYLQLFAVPRRPEDERVLAALYDNWILPGFHEARHYRPLTATPDPVFVLNDLFRNYEHCFVYDAPTLRAVLIDAGFSAVKQTPPCESEHSELCAIETHFDSTSMRLTIAMEATV